ncbi:MAG: hypothetical protein WBC40_04945 [Halobacteriota archaeon]
MAVFPIEIEHLRSRYVGKAIGKCIAGEEEEPIYIKQFGDTVDEYSLLHRN